MLQLALRLRICGLEAAERLGDLRRCPLRQRALRGLDICCRALGRRLYLRAFASAILACASPELCGEVFSPSFWYSQRDDPDNADDLEPTIFSATLTPHRSLGRVGFLVLMLLFGGVSFVTGMLFLLDRCLAGLRLFRARRAAAVLGVPAQLLAREGVRAGDGHALRTQGAQGEPSGRAREWVLNPALGPARQGRDWRSSASTGCFSCRAARNWRSRHSWDRTKRRGFAKELGKALIEARRGPTRTVFE